MVVRSFGLSGKLNMWISVMRITISLGERRGKKGNVKLIVVVVVVLVGRSMTGTQHLPVSPHSDSHYSQREAKLIDEFTFLVIPHHH